MRMSHHAWPVFRLLAGLCGLASLLLVCAVAAAAGNGIEGNASPGRSEARLVVKGTTDMSEVAD